MSSFNLNYFDYIYLSLLFIFAIFFGVVLVMIPEKQSLPINNIVDSLNSIFLNSMSSSIRRFNLFVLRCMILCLSTISLGRLVICLSLIKDSKGFKISVKGVLNSCDILVKNWIFLAFNSSFCFRWPRSSSAFLLSDILRVINLYI